MPKVTNTRKQRAATLLERISHGPAFSMPFDGSPLTVEEVNRAYRSWSQTWVLPDLLDLVSELRKHCPECFRSPFQRHACECRKGLQHD